MAAVGALALFGAFHLVSTAYYALGSRAGAASRPGPDAATELTANEQRIVSALQRILVEDGVPEAGRWAQAIVRAAPTEDLGYIALVTAQVRRESRFLAPDLEWIYSQLVPDLVHELGVPDPVHTIGPMQVQRWRLGAVFERTVGRRLEAHEVKELATDIEVGVAACVAVLDPIVREHVPDRRIRGWAVMVGEAGLNVPDDRVLARDWLGTLPDDRYREALHQKLLSDLTHAPLALDGVVGERTHEVAALVATHLTEAERAPFLARLAADQPIADTVAGLWRRRFGAVPPGAMTPRISHDPRLAFIFADFNSGRGCSRTAALQFLLRDLLGADLAVDGKRGPLTRAAMRELFEIYAADPDRRADFLALIDARRKPDWTHEQAYALAADLWRARHGSEPPRALVPDFWHGGFAQQVKGIGRISIEGYVAGSVRFFEDYYARLWTYTGQ